MAIYGNLRDYRFGDETDDIRGSIVYGLNEEKLGEIDDVIFDHGTGDLKYVVVETGGWLSSNKFLVPARQLTIREEGDEDYHVNLSKDQVKKLPQYQEDSVDREDDFREYESRYEASYSDASDILQREGTTHAITPTPDEFPAPARSSASFTGDSKVETPKPIARDLPIFGAGISPDTMQNPGVVDDGPREPVLSEPAIPRENDLVRGQGIGAENNRVSQPEYFGVDSVIPRESAVPAESMKAERDAPFDSGQAPLGERRRWARDGKRFKEFQERLRSERQEIVRRRDDRKAA